MNAAKVKPSQAHGNPEILRAKADAANRKREERVRQEAREQAKRETEERARQERARQEAEEKARKEAEEQRIRDEEAKMWEQVQPKAEKKAYKQGKIRTIVDGIEFDSLAKAMAHIDPVLWGKENDYRTSCWIKINRALKKDGQVVYGGHKYELAI